MKLGNQANFHVLHYGLLPILEPTDQKACLRSVFVVLEPKLTWAKLHRFTRKDSDKFFTIDDHWLEVLKSAPSG